MLDGDFPSVATVASEAAGGTRYCVTCGRSIPFDANVCPFCGHDFRFSTYPRMPEQPISEGMKIAFYILSLLFWPVGIILGLIYRSRPDPQSNHVGQMCLFLGIVSLILEFALPALLYISVIGLHTL